MSRVADLWVTFTEDEKNHFAALARVAFGDRGTQLVVAIARDARRHTTGSIALDRAAEVLEELDANPYGQYLPQPAGNLCEGCGRYVPEKLLTRWNYATHVPQDLCNPCYCAPWFTGHEEAS
jgi:hypothetical protein